MTGESPFHRDLSRRQERPSANSWNSIPDRRNANPWGLSEADSDTIDSFADPDSAGQNDQQQPPLSNMVAAAPSGAFFQYKLQTAAPSTPALTHVNSSGEAHMVDVGAKPATKRTAIVGAYVYFSNGEPFRLIFENANKKGDVLGVARVAGIMAAKQTSNLIPLCHPIAISKVNVEVKLLPSGAQCPFVGTPVNPRGAVEIEALVECVGSTGVEMEAMTAASVAAMTVVDMCKAVDRGIRFNVPGVLYKNGGKSGLHVYSRWAKKRGREYFLQHGLEVPTDISQARRDVEAQSGITPHQRASGSRKIKRTSKEGNNSDP